MQELLQDMKNDNRKLQELLDRNLSLLEQLKMEKELNEFFEDLNELGEALESGNDTLTNQEAKESFDELMETLDDLMENMKDAIQLVLDIRLHGKNNLQALGISVINYN